MVSDGSSGLSTSGYFRAADIHNIPPNLSETVHVVF